MNIYLLETQPNASKKAAPDAGPSILGASNFFSNMALIKSDTLCLNLNKSLQPDIPVQLNFNYKTFTGSTNMPEFINNGSLSLIFNNTLFIYVGPIFQSRGTG